MNLIKTYIDKSKIQGIGLFAEEFIKKGDLIWKLEKYDIIISDEDFDKLDSIKEDYFNKYSFHKNGTYCLCVDDAKYCNHSCESNTISTFFRQYAKQDIQIGEEITCNYAEIDSDFNRDKKF